jgi:hypothetical protein
MQVNAVRELGTRMIVESDLNQVPYTHTYKVSRYTPAERPERIFNPVREAPNDLPNFQVDKHVRRMMAVERGWYVRRRS